MRENDLNPTLINPPKDNLNKHNTLKQTNIHLDSNNLEPKVIDNRNIESKPPKKKKKKTWISILTTFAAILITLFISYKVLAKGIFIENLNIANIDINNIFLQLNHKLTLKIDSIILNESESSDTPPNLKEIINYTQKALYVLSYFETLEINDMAVSKDNHLKISYANSHYDISSRLFDAKFNVVDNKNNFYLSINQFVLKNIAAHLEGDFTFNIANKTLDFDIKAILDSKNEWLTLKGSTDFDNITLSGKSSKLQDLEEFKPFINAIEKPSLKATLNAWMYEKVKYKEMKIDSINANINLNNIAQSLLKNLQVKLHIYEAKVTLNKDNTPILSPEVILEFKNASLNITPLSPTLAGMNLSGSNVLIKGMPTPDVIINLNGSNVRLDSNLAGIMKSYGLTLPISQDSLKNNVKTSPNLELDSKEYMLAKGEIIESVNTALSPKEPQNIDSKIRVIESKKSEIKNIFTNKDGVSLSMKITIAHNAQNPQKPIFSLDGLLQASNTRLNLYKVPLSASVLNVALDISPTQNLIYVNGSNVKWEKIIDGNLNLLLNGSARNIKANVFVKNGVINTGNLRALRLMREEVQNFNTQYIPEINDIEELEDSALNKDSIKLVDLEYKDLNNLQNLDSKVYADFQTSQDSKENTDSKNLQNIESNLQENNEFSNLDSKKTTNIGIYLNNQHDLQDSKLKGDFKIIKTNFTDEKSKNEKSKNDKKKNNQADNDENVLKELQSNPIWDDLKIRTKKTRPFTPRSDKELEIIALAQINKEREPFMLEQDFINMKNTNVIINLDYSKDFITLSVPSLNLTLDTKNGLHIKVSRIESILRHSPIARYYGLEHGDFTLDVRDFNENKNNANITESISKDSKKLVNLESKDSNNLQNLDSKNLQNIESRFYTNNQFSSLNSKKVIESNFKEISHKSRYLHFISHPFPPTFRNESSEICAKSPTTFKENENIESKNLQNIESNLQENNEIANLDSKEVIESTDKNSIKLANLEYKTQNLDSKKQNQIEDSKLSSKAVHNRVRSTHRVPARFVVRKSGQNFAAVRNSAFLQEADKRGSPPLSKKSGCFFTPKGERGGGFALFCAEIANLQNQRSTPYNKKDSKENLYFTESKFYKTNEITNLDSIQIIESTNKDSIKLANLDSKDSKKITESNFKEISHKSRYLHFISHPIPPTFRNESSEICAKSPTTFKENENIESKNLQNTESRFYKNNEFTNLDSKEITKSINKDSIKLVNLDSKDTIKITESKKIQNLDSKNSINNKNSQGKNSPAFQCLNIKDNFTPTDFSQNENLESRFYETNKYNNLYSIKIIESATKDSKKLANLESKDSNNLQNLDSKENTDSKNLQNIESNLQENNKFDNLDSIKLVNLESKNENQIEDSKLSSKAVHNRVRSTQPCESRPLRSAKNRIQGDSSVAADFSQEADKRGSPLLSKKSGCFFTQKGSGEGDLRFFAPKSKIYNQRSTPYNKKDSNQNLESKNLQNIESTNKDSIKLANLDSKDTIKITESNFKEISHKSRYLHFISHPFPPTFRNESSEICAKSPTTFKENQNLESKNLQNTESRFYKTNKFANLESKEVTDSANSQNLDSNENTDSKNLQNIESNLQENNEITNLDSKKVAESINKDSIKITESKTRSLDSKNENQLGDSKRIDKAFYNRVRSTHNFPARFVVRKSGQNFAEVRNSAFSQEADKRGSLPLRQKSGCFFSPKGERGGGFALFCAEIDNLQNQRSTPYNKKDSNQNLESKNLQITESRFYKTNKFANLDSKEVTESANKDFKKLANLDSKDTKKVTESKKIQNLDSKDSINNENSQGKNSPAFRCLNIKENFYPTNFSQNENLESNLQDSKKNIESRFYKTSEITNLDSKKVTDSANSQNLDSKQNLESKNDGIYIKDLSDLQDSNALNKSKLNALKTIFIESKKDSIKLAQSSTQDSTQNIESAQNKVSVQNQDSTQNIESTQNEVSVQNEVSAQSTNSKQNIKSNQNKNSIKNTESKTKNSNQNKESKTQNSKKPKPNTKKTIATFTLNLKDLSYPIYDNDTHQKLKNITLKGTFDGSSLIILGNDNIDFKSEEGLSLLRLENYRIDIDEIYSSNIPFFIDLLKDKQKDLPYSDAAIRQELRLLDIKQKLRKKLNVKPIDFNVLGKNMQFTFLGYTAPFDMTNIRFIDGRIALDGQYEKGIFNANMIKDSIHIKAKNFSGAFANIVLMSAKDGKKMFEGGTFSLDGLYRDSILNATLEIQNTAVLEFKALQNIFAFIDTLPSLVMFKNPHLGSGYKISYGKILFATNSDYVGLQNIFLLGNSMDINGQGIIDKKSEEMNVNLSITTIKNLGKFINKIPIVGYLILGRKGEISTNLILTGRYSDPKVNLTLASDIIKMPINILRRVFPVEMLNESIQNAEEMDINY